MQCEQVTARGSNQLRHEYLYRLEQRPGHMLWQHPVIEPSPLRTLIRLHHASLAASVLTRHQQGHVLLTSNRKGLLGLRQLTKILHDQPGFFLHFTCSTASDRFISFEMTTRKLPDRLITVTAPISQQYLLTAPYHHTDAD